MDCARVFRFETVQGPLKAMVLMFGIKTTPFPMGMRERVWALETVLIPSPSINGEFGLVDAWR